MSFYVVDVEADGPIPGKYSMVSFGAVKVDERLDQTFFGQTRPISKIWVPESLAISNISRQEHESYEDPLKVMANFDNWLHRTSVGRPILISDNPMFDGMYMAWYFHTYLERNPFGFSARRIGDLYCGMKMDARTAWKHLRKTRHDHHPVNDAKGNAEALLEMKKLGLKIKFE